MPKPRPCSSCRRRLSVLLLLCGLAAGCGSLPVAPSQLRPPGVVAAPSPVGQPPAATPGPLAPAPIVVDNRDAGFVAAGDWYAAVTGQQYGPDCLWAHRGIQNTAYFRPELPVAGVYAVAAWWCGNPNHDQTPRLLQEIHTSTVRVAPNIVLVNTQVNGGSWQSLGSYSLEPGAQVTVVGSLGGNVVADAVQFTYLGPDAPQVTPTPLPTPFPWTNHPPPLEQVTAGDLTARLGIVQPRFSYAYTPVLSTVDQTYDDCTVFPRSGCGGEVTGRQVTVGYQELVVEYRVSADYRYVSLAPNAELARRQILYFTGSDNGRYFRVETFAEQPGVWRLSVAAFGDVPARHRELDAATAATVQEIAQRYSTVTFGAAEGARLTLYGLGPVVEPFTDDAARLTALGTAFLAELPLP